MPKDVAAAATSGVPMAGTTRLAPGRTTIVRPASAASRRRSTRSSCAPSWSFAPSWSAVAEEIATPSTSVPALEPASSMRAPPPLPPSEIRACTRETLGSASTTVLPGARPRARVGRPPAVAAGGDPRGPAGDAGGGEPDRPPGRGADRHVADGRHPRLVGEHELERRGGPRHGRPAGAAVVGAPRELT